MPRASLPPIRQYLFVMKLEHVGIAVKDLETASPLFETLLNTRCYKTETVDSEGVQTAFFQAGASKIELLATTRDDGPIARFIAKRGEGIHHLAFEVSDIDFEIDRLQRAGYRLIDTVPKSGADNKRIAFLHPRSTNGVLVELCQEKSDKD